MMMSLTIITDLAIESQGRFPYMEFIVPHKKVRTNYAHIII